MQSRDHVNILAYRRCQVGVGIFVVSAGLPSDAVERIKINTKHQKQQTSSILIRCLDSAVSALTESELRTAYNK